MDISNTGSWMFGGSTLDSQHVFDEKLCNSMIEVIKSSGFSQAYDFGCGQGKYTSSFNLSGIDTVGFDGNPHTGNYLKCFVQDLTSPFFSAPPRDVVVCLEVCEHVPQTFESVLLQNIDKHVNPRGLVILSWAVVGQAGLGHVNCQNNDYVIQKFQQMHYVYKEDLSNKLRLNSDKVKAPWFSNTVMVFSKSS